ncbi:MAG: hypothetical protein IPL79_01840 [Myxococcales bacterium]|nr:hypothetical protein [Myxococcales bacterium]
MQIQLNIKKLAVAALMVAVTAGSGCLDEGSPVDDADAQADKRALNEDFMSKYFPTAERRLTVLQAYSQVALDPSQPVWHGGYAVSYTDDVAAAVTGATQDSYYWLANPNAPSRDRSKKEWASLLKSNWALAAVIWPQPQHEVFDATTGRVFGISDLQQIAMTSMVDPTLDIDGGRDGKTHPAAMYIALVNGLGMAAEKTPFVINYAYAGDYERQVVMGYETSLEPITGEDANQCIGGVEGIPGYGAALGASSLFKARTTLKLARYTGTQVELQLSYILESKDGVVVGGEWCRAAGTPQSVYLRVVKGGGLDSAERPVVRQLGITYLASLVTL